MPAWPGGNATGFSDVLADLSSKFVGFAEQPARPGTAIGYLWHTAWPDGQNRFQTTERAAQSSGVELISRGISEIDEENDAITLMKDSGVQVLIIQPSPFTYRHRNRLIGSAVNHDLGPVVAWPPSAREHALIGYGPDYVYMYGQVGSYISRILKGAKPADLPVQEPTKFQLVTNLKTAKTLGLAVPASLLGASDEVIE